MSGAQPREGSRCAGSSLCNLGPGHSYVNSGGPSMVVAFEFPGAASLGAGGNSTCRGLEVGNATTFDGPQPGGRDRAAWDEVGG